MVAPMPSARTLRRLAIGLAIVVLVLVLAVRLFAMTPMARSLVEARIEAMSIRGQSVEIEGLEGDLLGLVRVDKITLSDDEGVWLIARDTELDWSPLALLSRTLSLRQITVEQVALARPPQLAARASPSNSQASPFKRYRLEYLTVAALILEQGIAGPAQTYRIEAALDAGAKNADLAFDLRPLEATGDKVHAEFRWAVNTPLLGTLELSAKPDGVIASLLDTPPGQSIEATLSAEGTRSEWGLTGTGTIGGNSFIAIEGDRTGETYTLIGTSNLTSIGRLERLRQRVGDYVSMNGSLAVDQDAPLLALEFGSPAFVLEAVGEILRSDGQITLQNLDLHAEQIDLARLFNRMDIAMTSVDLAGDLAFGGGAFQFDGEARTPRLKVEDRFFNDLQSVGRHRYADGRIDLDAAVTTTGVDGFDGTLDKLFGGALKLETNLSMEPAFGQVRLSSLVLSSPKLRANASGQISLQGATALTGDVSLRGISAIEQLDGAWRLSGETWTRARLDINGKVSPNRSMPLPDIAFDQLLDLSLGLTRDAAGGVDLRDLSLSGDRFSIAARGSVAATRLDLSGNMSASETEFQGIEFDPVQSSFTVRGRPNAPILDVEATSDSLRYGGYEVEAVQLSAQLTFGSASSFFAKASGALLGAPLSVESTGSITTSLATFDSMSLAWADLTATGVSELRLSEPAASTINLSISGRAPYVGALDGRVDYVGRALNANVSVANADYGRFKLNTGTMDVSGDWPNFEGSVQLDGEIDLLDTNRTVQSHLPFSVNPESQSLTVRGSVQLDKEKINFIDPLVLSVVDRSVTGAFDAFAGRIDFNVTETASPVSSVSFSNIDLARLGPLLKRPSFRGAINGTAQIEQRDQSLEGEAQVSITDLARGRLDAPSADVRLNAAIDANRLSVVLVASDEADALNLQATLETVLLPGKGLYATRLIPGGVVPISISGGGPIEPLWALVAPADLRLEGDVQVDLNNGDGETFILVGPFGFSNVEFEDGLTGLHLNGVQISAALDETGISIERAVAHGANGGNLDASGQYRFDGSGAIDLRLRSLDAFNRSDIKAILTGNASIDRQRGRTQISGDIGIDRADIDLSKIRNDGYVTLDVAFNAPDSEVAAEPSVRDTMALDLSIKADRRIFVRSPGVDTEWAVDARVRGSPSAPQLSGQARILRGDADLLSRRFRISDGLVRFLGAPEQSVISVRADRSAGDVTTSIRVTGSVESPEIELASDPSLPDDEIISRVLFGRSPSQLSPLQAAQLAGAAAQFASGDAFNLTGDLQAATGLDRLDLGFNDAGEALLSTGKYIADDVYLEIETGVSGAPGIALEWTPLENVEVDADIDPERGPKIAIQWRHDFDRLPGQTREDE